MDIVATIAAVTAAMGFARELMSVDAQVDQASLKLKIAELTEALATAKLGLVDVNDHLREMDQEITRLTKQLAFRKVSVVDWGEYRYRAVKGHPVGLPFCPVCEQSGTYINLVQDWSGGHGIKYRCPRCKSDYGSNVVDHLLPADVATSVNPTS